MRGEHPTLRHSPVGALFGECFRPSHTPFDSLVSLVGCPGTSDSMLNVVIVSRETTRPGLGTAWLQGHEGCGGSPSWPSVPALQGCGKLDAVADNSRVQREFLSRWRFLG